MRSPQLTADSGVAHVKEDKKSPSVYCRNLHGDYFVYFHEAEIQKAINKFRQNRMENEFLPTYRRVTKSYFDKNGNWIIEWEK